VAVRDREKIDEQFSPRDNQVLKRGNLALKLTPVADPTIISSQIVFIGPSVAGGGQPMQRVDCITFVDDATGCGGSVTVFQKDDASVLIDVQLADKPASVLSLPGDLARRLGEAVIRAAT